MNIADIAQHVHALEKKVKEQTDEIERLREDNKQYLECLTIMATVALGALKPKDGD